MNPEISVIVPTYNRESLLPPTLDSILCQTCPPAEVIVVDDGSTDGTREILSRRYAGRVRCLSIENSGVCRARNIGVRNSRSPWIAFCDSDDLWLPERLQMQLQLLNLAPEIEYFFTDFSYVHGADWAPHTKFSESSAWQARLQAERLADKFSVIREPLYLDFLEFVPIFPSAVLMSRRRFDAMGGFDERWSRTSIEDFDFTLRCMETPPFGVVNQSLVGIRRHDSNASGNRVRDLVAYIDILKCAKIHHRLGPPNSAFIDRLIRNASIEAAELAFSAQQLDIVRALLEPIPPSALSAKMRIKRTIAIQPQMLRSALSTAIFISTKGVRSVKRASRPAR